MGILTYNGILMQKKAYTNIAIYARTQSSVTPSVIEFGYSTNGGATWTTQTTTVGTEPPYTSINSSPIVVSAGTTVNISCRNTLNQDVTFSDGYNNSSYIGHCGQSSPYSFIANGQSLNVYLNIEVLGGNFVTCP
jgi:hypothetical protein